MLTPPCLVLLLVLALHAPSFSAGSLLGDLLFKDASSLLGLGTALAALRVDMVAILKERERTGSQWKAPDAGPLTHEAQCQEVPWCDAEGVCSTVCARGTVVVDPWLQHAVTFQRRLSRRLPFCYAALPATHNSGITLADGYGNRDRIYQQYMAYLQHWLEESERELRTNNQVLSLTDQLNLGVRMLEIDTHWVEGDLRIAHCGGFHAPMFNWLVNALNILSQAFGHPIRWDTETVGCSPSLSSIAVRDQRTLRDALQEVHVWMQRPDNADEFVVLFFDDQIDLKEWGKVTVLLDQITGVLPVESILTPKDLATTLQGVLPSIDVLVGMGKRILLLSEADYGADMAPLFFNKIGGVCDMVDVGAGRLHLTPPNCSVQWGPHHSSSAVPMDAGRLVRANFCALQYGPMNCSMTPGINSPTIDAKLLAEMSQCGVNFAAIEGVTPALMADQVWSWAPGHPKPLFPPSPEAVAATTAARRTRVEACAVISRTDGRWYSAPCGAYAPIVCRRVQDESTYPGPQLEWTLSPPPSTGGVSTCPPGFNADAPHCSRENAALASMLKEHAFEVALLPLIAPDYEPTWLVKRAAPVM